MATVTYMGTIKIEKGVKRRWKQFINDFDLHKWVIGKEKGKDGYEHYQVRFNFRDDSLEGFLTIKTYFPTGHFEKASEVFEYERKEGRYWTSEDTRGILWSRYGRLSGLQLRILAHVKRQGDRNITVIFDPKGNSGKSWLCRRLFESGEGYYVPPTVDTVKGIIQFIASGYRGQQIIVIDIPRSWKWSEQLYTAIESIKDGLVYDTRYSAKTRDIYGVKVLVFTNTLPTIGALSIDRWDIMDITSMPKGIPHSPTHKELGRIGLRRARKRAINAKKEKGGESVPMAEETPFKPHI